jgi:hypothetical protein
VRFLVDQRKCDLFALIACFMSVYNTDKQFKVLDMKAFTREDGLVSFYVDFEENDPKFKSKAPLKQHPTGEDSASPAT